jgi:hypothetical protein
MEGAILRFAGQDCPMQLQRASGQLFSTPGEFGRKEGCRAAEIS